MRLVVYVVSKEAKNEVRSNFRSRTVFLSTGDASWMG